MLHAAHPYHLALAFALERIYRLLKAAGQDDLLTYIVCEARGAREDAELELEFRRIRDGAADWSDGASTGSLLNLAQGKFGRYNKNNVRWLAAVVVALAPLVVGRLRAVAKPKR